MDTRKHKPKQCSWCRTRASHRATELLQNAYGQDVEFTEYACTEHAGWLRGRYIGETARVEFLPS